MGVVEQNMAPSEFAVLQLHVGGFPVIPETTHSHVFAKEMNHASTCSQNVHGIYIVKIVCDCFLP